MNNLNASFKNNDGSVEILQIISNDNYVNPLRNNQTYKLANKLCEQDNKFVSKFKNSILGSDVGIKSEGFSTIAILSTIIAISSILIMYILWRL